MTSTLAALIHPSRARFDEWESIEPPMENDSHRDQLEILIACLRWWWRDRSDCYITGNSTIFFSPDQKTNENFRGPDFFVVLGVDPRPRGSWMVWREDYKYPNLIIELLSDSTAKTDRTTKKDIYQTTFKTPEYFWFHPDTFEFEGFRLQDTTYQAISATPQGWKWSEQLQLYLGIYQNQLRYFTAEGALIPTPLERAEQAEQELQQEQQRAEQAEQELQRLQQRLRDLGFDP